MNSNSFVNSGNQPVGSNSVASTARRKIVGKVIVGKVRDKARHLDAIDHLGPEAVAAFVDGEMPPKAMHRVRIHLVHCDECRAEVHRQRTAASWVRSRDDTQALHAPVSLVEKLNDIAAFTSDERELSQTGEPDFLEKIRHVLKRNDGGDKPSPTLKG